MRQAVLNKNGPGGRFPRVRGAAGVMRLAAKPCPSSASTCAIRGQVKHPTDPPCIHEEHVQPGARHPDRPARPAGAGPNGSPPWIAWNRLELPGRLLKRFVALAVQHQTPSSPPSARCNGPPSRAMHSPLSGRTAWAWCAGSPDTPMVSTPVTRFRHPGLPPSWREACCADQPRARRARLTSSIKSSISGNFLHLRSPSGCMTPEITVYFTDR